LDFTRKTYEQLLNALVSQGVLFYPFTDMPVRSAGKEGSSAPWVILRHDVDLKPGNSLVFAKIQHHRGIRGTYYFRAVPQSWDEGVIRAIHEMGHEVGYHYECLTTTNGNIEAAYDDFRRNLERLRKLAPVTTICMHGSPRSRFDSRDLWKTYDYRSLGIIGEPYFDIDFNSVRYLTDTGRMWDGERYSVRDKGEGKYEGRSTKDEQRENRGWDRYHTTFDIIRAVREGTFPEQVMMTFHPQRWTDNPFEWTKELVWQNVKNVVKRGFYASPPFPLSARRGGA
jgi:hypothetical protein